MSTRRQLIAAGASLVAAALWIACSDNEPTDTYQRPECRVDADCRLRVDFGCGRMLCVEGACEWEVFEVSTSQRRGDCEIVQCRPDGGKHPRFDPDDIYDDGNLCTDDICDETDTQNHSVPRPPGPSPSGSGFCDGYGYQISCLTNEDCRDSALFCSSYGTCIPHACGNTRLDPDIGESDVDCGGPCDVCRITTRCNTGKDCAAGVCGPDKTCLAATCTDGVANNNETDVDCGYGCDSCPDGEKCMADVNCDSRVCFAGQCQPRTCQDGKRNGEEEKVDCGGDCPPCP